MTVKLTAGMRLKEQEPEGESKFSSPSVLYFKYSFIKLITFIYIFSLYPNNTVHVRYKGEIYLKEKRNSKSKMGKRLWVLLSLIVVVMASMTFAASAGHYKEVSVAGAISLPSNSVNSALNVTLSHLSYTTQPPQFLVNASNYAKNATYVKGTGAWVTNQTYQIFQYNNTTSTSTASALSYDFSSYLGTPSYIFSDSKIALNGTMTSPGLQIIFSNSTITSAITSTVMLNGTGGQTAANKSTAQEFWIDINATSYSAASSYTYNASFHYWYLNANGNYVVNNTSFSGSPLFALNLYEIQFNIQNGTQQVSVIYTNNGTVAQNTKILSNSNATKTPMLNFKHIGNVSYVLSPVTSGASAGFILDWMYVVDHNTYTYYSSSGSAMPAISWSASNLATQPFDPASTTGVSNFQAANQTGAASQAKVSNDLISSVSNITNTTSLQNSVGLNSTYTSSYTSTYNSVNAVYNTAYSNVSNITTTVNEQAQTWSTQYVKNVVVNFLKDYAAAQASKNGNVYVSPSDITLISYNIGSIILDTNYSASAAGAIMDYLDNTYASVLAANNLSVVNPTTNAIVAGADAGDFYYQGTALVPIVHGNNIINPITGQAYTIQSAGFVAGTYISSGAVIVPQYEIAEWVGGTPVFTAGSISLGSIFTTLSSGGKAISNLFESAASTIPNGIGPAPSVTDNNVVTPINAGPRPTVIKNDISNLIASATGITGFIPENVQSAITSGSVLTSGAVNSISGNLLSTGSDIASAIMAGYDGAKSAIYDIAAGVDSGLYGTPLTGIYHNVLSTSASGSIAPSASAYVFGSGFQATPAFNFFGSIASAFTSAGQAIVNTAHQVASTATAVLSPVYTSAANFISGSASDISKAVVAAGTSTYTALHKAGVAVYNAAGTAGKTLLNAAGTALNYVKNGATTIWKSVSSTIGGIANAIYNGLKSIWSFFAGLPALVTHFLLYIAIGGVAVLGIIIAIMVMRRESSKIPGERGI